MELDCIRGKIIASRRILTYASSAPLSLNKRPGSRQVYRRNSFSPGGIRTGYLSNRVEGACESLSSYFASRKQIYPKRKRGASVLCRDDCCKWLVVSEGRQRNEKARERRRMNRERLQTRCREDNNQEVSRPSRVIRYFIV